jgi:hypothetical protein
MPNVEATRETAVRLREGLTPQAAAASISLASASLSL